MFTRRAVTSGLLALPLSAFAAPAIAQTRTRLRFAWDWRFDGPSAPVLFALDRGFFAAEGLDVTIESSQGAREAISRIAANTFDMGFSDINSMIRFRDENPESGLRCVLMTYDRPPFAIVGRKSRGITSDPRSLLGKRFGAPAPDASFAQWPIFRTVNNLDESTMRFENVGFGVRDAMLVRGEVDAVFGFVMSVLPTLEAQGMQMADVEVLMMADHGVELYGSGNIVNPRFLAQNPESVRAFNRAFIRGWREALRNQGAATDSIIRRNDVAVKAVEEARFRMVAERCVLTPWVRANGLGGVDRARLGRAIDQIGLTMQYRAKPRVEDVFDDSFLPPSPADRAIV